MSSLWETGTALCNGEIKKLLEEAPAWGLAPELQAEMGQAAVRAARAVGYESAGTVEFLLDPDGRHFYFMEMNTRIQVEHGITEMVSGVDLVREQLRIASGLPLSVTQEAVHITGHAMGVPRQCGGPGGGFPPLSRHGGISPLSRRSRGSGGLLPLHRLSAATLV